MNIPEFSLENKERYFKAYLVLNFNEVSERYKHLKKTHLSKS